MRTEQRQDFDSPWKEALDAYFPEFMGFFFPDIHAAIDWSCGYTFLDKEFQKITRDAATGRRHVDKLVQIFLINGGETWLLIHVEIQGQPDTVFPERMFIYHYRILDRYNKDTVSLGVLSDPDPGFRPGPHVREHFGCRTEFHFPTVKVLDYKADWEKLERSKNPFAVVVMAHLKAQELDLGKGEERKQWKLRLIRLLYECGFERKNVLQLFRFIDWLLMLPPELEKIFTEEVHKIEEEKDMEYITSVERVGIEKGIKQGMLQGIEQGMLQGIEQGIEQGMLLNTRGVLLEVLSLRFGPPTVDLCELVEGITDYETLKRLHRSAVLCSSLEEFRAGLDRKV
ncbi:hypothetical protein [Candidatus Electrothrix sp.]|uniref:hypothetical protein n=2 Tax=Candidatus Electrothrix sp. TaxID=2170559 RepID=UPI004056ACA8